MLSRNFSFKRPYLGNKTRFFRSVGAKMTARGSRLAILGHIDEKPAQGWGPVDWVGRVLQEAKFEEKKVFLHCKGSGIWGNAITEVHHNFSLLKGMKPSLS